MSTRVITRGALVAAGVAAAAISVSACSGSLTATGTANGGNTTTPSTVNTTVAQPPAGSTTTRQNANPATSPAATPSAAVAAKQAPLTPECKAADLKLSFGGNDASMSQQYQVLRFTNVGTRSCVIVGFPGVSYVAGDNGTQVGPAAVRDGKIGPQVTLVPGAVASTVIHSVDAQVFDQNVCHPTRVRGFRVYAPDDRAAMFIPIVDGWGCAGTTPDPQLSVVTTKPGLGNPDPQ